MSFAFPSKESDLMKQSKSSLRSLIFGALLILLASAALFATSCGPNHEQVIRDQLTSELDSIKNLDESFTSTFASDPSMTELEEFGIDTNEFIAAYLGGFDYRIDDVTVDGDTATATVVLTTKSFSEFNDAVTASLDSLLNDESVYNLSQDELYARLGQAMMDAINSLPTHENEPLQITYELIDNTWTPTADSASAVENALISN